MFAAAIWGSLFFVGSDMDVKSACAWPSPLGRTSRPLVALSVLLCALMLAGCRADPNMQLVERELALQDQQIFKLEDHLADCHALAAEYRREIASLRRQLDSKGGASSSGRPDSSGAGGLSMPDVTDNGDSADSPPDNAQGYEPEYDGYNPLSDPPPPFTPQEGTPPTPADDNLDADGDPASAEVYPASEPLPLPIQSAEAIDHVHLAQQIFLADTASGSQAEIDVTIQPRDVHGQVVRASGEVSLMLLELLAEGEREIARWHFSADETRRMWQAHSTADEGIHVRLPWPGTPKRGEYRLWARMTHDAGKHLEKKTFDVDPQTLAKRRPPPQPDPPAMLADANAPQPRSAPKPAQRIDPWRASAAAARIARSSSPTSEDVTSDNASTAPDPWSPNRPQSTARQQWSPYR